MQLYIPLAILLGPNQIATRRPSRILSVLSSFARLPSWAPALSSILPPILSLAPAALLACLLALPAKASFLGGAPADGIVLGQSPSDGAYTGRGLALTVTDMALKFTDSSVATYERSGRYTYVPPGGGASLKGRWFQNGDNSICIEFRNGHVRCDTYVRSGLHTVLITSAGQRFVVRLRTPL